MGSRPIEAHFTFAAIVWVVGLGLGAALIAPTRQRSPTMWFLFGAILGPVAWALLYLAPPGACQSCGTPTRGWLRVCWWCREDVRAPSASTARIVAAMTQRLKAGEGVLASDGGAAPGPVEVDVKNEPLMAARVEIAPPVRAGGPSIASISWPGRSGRGRTGRKQAVPTRENSGLEVAPDTRAPVARAVPDSGPAPVASAVPDSGPAPVASAVPDSRPAPVVRAAPDPLDAPTNRQMTDTRDAPAGDATPPKSTKPAGLTPARPIPEPYRLSSDPANGNDIEGLVATAVYVTGRAPLEPGRRYGIALRQSRFQILGPMDVQPTSIVLDRDVASMHAVEVEGRLVVTDSSSAWDATMAFMSVAGPPTGRLATMIVEAPGPPTAS